MQVSRMNSHDYYRLYQEVQSAKQAARTNIKVELATHERLKHKDSVVEVNKPLDPVKGNSLDIRA